MCNHLGVDVGSSPGLFLTNADTGTCCNCDGNVFDGCGNCNGTTGIGDFCTLDVNGVTITDGCELCNNEYQYVCPGRTAVDCEFGNDYPDTNYMLEWLRYFYDKDYDNKKKLALEYGKKYKIQFNKINIADNILKIFNSK